MSESPLYELPEELRIDTAVARRIIAEFIRGQLRQAGFERVVLGLSGGIDSALVAYLVAEAIGAERLLAVLMPYAHVVAGVASDAEEVVARPRLRQPSWSRSAPMVDGYFGIRGGEAVNVGALGPEGLDASGLRRGNFVARTRMAVLYDQSVAWGGLVVGTGNKTETLIGYTTLFGDSACAFNPIGDLYKSQVRQLAAACGVPDAIVRKAPSADLWPGQTDESEVGFTYATRRPAPVLADRQAALRRGGRAMGFEPRHRRARRPDGRGRRVQAPGAAHRQARAAHGRRRLPLPAPPARARRARGDGAPTAPAGGTLYVVATPIGNLGDITLRALEVLRAVPLVAAEDTRLTRRLWSRHGIDTRLVSYHARNAALRAPELLGHLRGGADLALVTDAGTPLVSDPGEGLVRDWADEGGRVVPIPGASAVLAALVASGMPARALGVRGLPAAKRRRAPGAAGAPSPPTGGRPSCSRRPSGPPRPCATWPRHAAPTAAAALCRELTKLHEEVRRGTLAALADEALAEPPRGEVTIVVAGPPRVGTWRTGATRYRRPGRGASHGWPPWSTAGSVAAAAAKQVAAETGLPRRDLYDAP